MKIRTGFSFRYAVGKVPEVAALLKEQGWEYAPISDRASTFGYCQWRNATEKLGLKPIYGVEIAVTPSVNAKKPAVDYWSFFAKDDLRILNDLVATATNQFRYEPLLTYEQALAMVDSLVVITGHRPNFEKLKDLTEDKVGKLKVPARYNKPFFPIGPSTAGGALKAARRLNMPFMLNNDNRYPTPGRLTLYETICGRNASVQTYPQCIMDREHLFNYALHELGMEQDEVKKAQDNMDISMSQCNATLKQGQLLTPEKPLTLRQMCLNGADKLGVDLSDPEYMDRLDRELKLIDEKEFENYFYIIADAVTWARERMLVGPARGSSCGSLVCYLLEITTVDPIPYGLIFERFIDVNRNDLPDIDIDFADTKRELVFEYMRQKYGADHIARLGTSSLYKPKSAINEACAALNIPSWETKAVVDSIVQRSSGDSRAMNALEDTFDSTTPGKAFVEKYPQVRISQEMEGHPRHYGQHAAGIVVTAEPVINYVAVDSRNGSAMCDKKDAEELDLLKIDALGLTQLSILQDVLEYTGRPLNFFDTLPTDDEAAFKVLNDKRYAGIFQFNGMALKSVARQIPFTHLEDIISVTALARPGPLASGGTHEWILRKNGQSPLTYPHPLFEPYLSNSLGIVIYQEQVMEIGRNIGDLSWGDVTALRKAMSKSLGKEYFDQFGDRWKEGARQKGIPDNVLDKVWDDLCAYGAWSFNRSHSVAYGLISYYCCWAKAHHPYEFAAASLSHESNPDSKMLMLRELNAEGIDYVPVLKDVSTDRWEVGEHEGKKVLVGPLSGVRGMGPKLVQGALSARSRGEGLPPRAEKLLETPKTDIDTIWPVRDSFATLMPDPRERNIWTKPLLISEIVCDGTFQDDLLCFVVMKKIAPRDENEVVNVAKRGGKRLDGPSIKLNLRVADDTEEMLAMVGRYDYETIGKPIVDRGGVGKSLYAIKGKVMPDFKMFIIKQAKYIGEMQ